MRIRLLISALSTVAFLNIGAQLALAQNSEVDWGARESNGIGTATGQPLPNGSGDLLWIGHFTLTNAQIAANATNESFLLSNFVIYAVSAPGAGTPNGAGTASDGYWLINSQSSTASAGTGSNGTLMNINIQNTEVTYWLFNSPTVAGATQYGIFTDPSGANAQSVNWVFPSDNVPGNVTIVDLADVPQNASGILFGSFGTGTSRDAISPLYNLALIPEPSSLALVGFGVGLIAVARLRRRKA